MSRPAIALAIVLVSVAAAIGMAADPAPRSGCTSSCNISDHMAMMSAGATLAMHTMAGMNDMPGMGAASTPSPKPGDDVMLQSMNDMLMERGGHMTMTISMPESVADRRRAADILAALRKAIEPFKDYRAAEAAGYKQFLAQLPQPIYHFTNYQNAFLNQFSFDPARPTSLMYKTVPGGFELVGAMYTAPVRSTNEQLNARVPLSVATWHLHTNLCLPPVERRSEMWGAHPRFGLAGSITTPEACAKAGGTFRPVIYNWMVHVWPMESDPSKIWATQEHPGAMNR